MNKTLRHICTLLFCMSLSYFKETSFASFPICFRVNNYSGIFSRKRRSFSNSVASGFSGLKTMIFSLNCFRNFLSLHLHHFRYFSGSVNKSRFFYTIHFFLEESFFLQVFQIQWLGRISLF